MDQVVEYLSGIVDMWQGTNQTRSILEGLKAVLLGEPASNRMSVIERTKPSNQEYMVWGPHLFEKALKRNISQNL